MQAFRLVASTAVLPGEVQILGDPRAVLAERFGEQADASFRFRDVVDFEVDVQQIDVPGQLDVVSST